MIAEIKALFIKDLQLELKQKYSINSIVLYVLSTVFVAYLSYQGNIDSTSWNVMFWIILLFAAVNATSKSFVQERPSRHLYYYTMAAPQSVIIAKILYNSLMMIIIAIITFIVFQLFLGNMIVGNTLFFVSLLLGALGFASTLTMVAAIASRSDNNFALMAILSFPLMLPFLLSLIALSNIALVTAEFTPEALKLLGMTFGLNLVVIMLSYILFPYLWKE
ncbi:MAG: heme exporter protein CcmB [Bacteroidales bacterium]|nr:heme exporter protein CcmB [Bacteroidales bacterium]